MEELSDKVRARLAELSAGFTRQLGARLDEIRSLAQADPDDLDSMRELRTRVHRLCGSAATFGFEQLTQQLAQIEQGIERALAATPPRLPDELRARIERLTDPDGSVHGAEPPDAGRDSETGGSREGVDPATRQRSGSSASPEPASEGNRRVVVMVGEMEIRPARYADQLSVFGMSFCQAEDLADLEDYLTYQFETSAQPVDHAILLAPVSYLSERVARLQQLARIRERFGSRLVAVLVGDRDDFETRLRSVRFGADILLSMPVEIANLIDRIEGVVGERVAQPYHIMIIDDDPDQVSSTALALQQAGMITSVVTDPRNLFQILVEQRPELILMDMYMPMCSGPELAAIIRQNEAFVGIPIVFLSVETDVEKQLEALARGADGFIEKPVDPERLVTSVRTRAARMRAMRYFMERDSLTGLLNHTNLKERLDNEMQRARRMGASVVFAMIDLDRFKSVNDTHGHFVGDRVLKSLARLLQERLRRTDVIGRYGGEEFGLILFNTDADNAFQIMDEIREGFSRIRHSAGEGELTVTLSCGLADSTAFSTSNEIGEAADGALYRAKQEGRNRVTVARRSDRAVPG